MPTHRILEMRNSAEHDGLDEPLVGGVNKDLDAEAIRPVMTGEDGLSTEEARKLTEEWGPNALPENKKSKVSRLRAVTRARRARLAHSPLPHSSLTPTPLSPRVRSSCCSCWRSPRRWRC